MSSASVEPPPWSRRRWWTTIAVFFGAQVALVFWLNDRSPARPRQPEAVPTFRFAITRSGERLALEDPTLYALPHVQGFSGDAWLKFAPVRFNAADWSESARFLPQDSQELGLRFRDFIGTNSPPPFPAIASLRPERMYTGNFAAAPPPAASRLRVEGDLAKRRLLLVPELQVWTNTDLLTNSVVQLLVDPQGNPVSAALLRPGLIPSPKQEEANQRALELARATRFEPVRAGLSIGVLIFEWQTIPVASTNRPAAAP